MLVIRRRRKRRRNEFDTTFNSWREKQYSLQPVHVIAMDRHFLRARLKVEVAVLHGYLESGRP